MPLFSSSSQDYPHATYILPSVALAIGKTIASDDTYIELEPQIVTVESLCPYILGTITVIATVAGIAIYFCL